ncbi:MULTISPECIES: hypothetical protein [unclassified Mucilaginibacter]|uniref:hypothetical protein n=1 Tax=unclassified Mucilaginibacter TaxID=2617802 RepID=UPI002AC8BED5|nr:MULTISPECIES: hypothetical protein [unclassified Mucilaginibacter]MEB0262309.1 hypothetical protein [Mucilaginibacter sp. 10I4]MEB0279956.1 hypothetical protein [Mucilaginibacter sp. 10B2]MEB0301802.1 hypothetical protein [Mucilaginibacter sp. 5C4]WPX21914.1 hypothetical protein RHM67_11520 [Mucilaginibacter sp. 5C4]
MKVQRFLIVIINILLSSCGFNVTDNPGEQMSSSIDVSKNHSAFICAYQVQGNNINGIPIKTIFAEKEYWLDKGLFGKHHVDCCKSHLVIVSKGYFATDSTGYDINWELINFKSQHSSIIFKDYNGILFPDSIPIIVVSIKGKDSSQVIKKLTLYKIKTQ